MNLKETSKEDDDEVIMEQIMNHVLNTICKYLLMDKVIFNVSDNIILCYPTYVLPYHPLRVFDIHDFFLHVVYRIFKIEKGLHNMEMVEKIMVTIHSFGLA